MRKRSVSQLQVEFLVVTQQPNITQEVADAIKMQCEPSEDINPGVCVLAGGLVIQEDSITVENNDPCAEQPCPGNDVFTCRPRPNTTGRFVCSCKTGFLKVNVLGTPGMCKDVDECDGGERVCEEEHECINTPGSFVCRQKPSALGQNAKVMKKLAIAFGVLFFIALFVIVGFVYLLKKKNKSNRELVPMSATSGFDNDAYHK
ncbi:adhesion G protein-coupled receptor E2-like [Homarus americanus]|uniref:adhesion G protein-coupled receptor E2-like n=1 Tax=Homarus americanus TaxID=6706 RepID=UPI001C449A62|nr:adhesion G protein-coupled receptor E2-like [Homarus americanus]